MSAASKLARAQGTSVVETLLLMGLAALLALGALPALRSYLGSAMVYVVECVINEDCRR